MRSNRLGTLSTQSSTVTRAMCAPKLAVSWLEGERRLGVWGVQKSRIADLPHARRACAGSRHRHSQPNGRPAEPRKLRQTARSAPPSTATGCELLETGADRLDALLDLIAGAEQSLRLIFYIFASDEAGRPGPRCAGRSAEARRASCGCCVDGFGARPAPSPTSSSRSRDAGGDFCLFNPSYGRRYLIRNHQKLVVADEQRARSSAAPTSKTTYLTDDGPEALARPLAPDRRARGCKPASRYFDALFRWTKTKGAKMRHAAADCRSATARSAGHLQWKFCGPISRKHQLAGVAGPRACRRQNGVDLIAAYFSPPGSLHAAARPDRAARPGADDHRRQVRQ